MPVAGRRIVVTWFPVARVVPCVCGMLTVVSLWRYFRGTKIGSRPSAWSPHGTCLVAGGEDGTLCLWDAESGKPLAVLQGYERGVWLVAGRRMVGDWSPPARAVFCAYGMSPAASPWLSFTYSRIRSYAVRCLALARLADSGSGYRSGSNAFPPRPMAPFQVWALECCIDFGCDSSETTRRHLEPKAQPTVGWAMLTIGLKAISVQ